MGHVCDWKYVHTFDNVLRPWFHNPDKIFGPYVKPGMRVADIGCGAGFTSLGLARLLGKAGEILSVDLQPEMLDMVRKRADKAGLSDRIHTRVCEPDNLRLDGMFDFANAFWMVHEVPNTEKFMRQVRACLNPGGKLLIAEPLFHVSASAFEKIIKTAADQGLSEYGRPRVRFSRAVVMTSA